MKKNLLEKFKMSRAPSAVLENADLLRIVGDYLHGAQLPLALSFKAARDALKPINAEPHQKWITSKKNYFAASVPMVEWAQSLGCEFHLTRWSNNLFTYAALNGSVDVLRWAHQKYPPNQYPAGIRVDVCRSAAENGHLQVLQYLRSFGTIAKMDETVCSGATCRGHLHVLQWLREVSDPPHPWNVWNFVEAAGNGHLHVLQLFRDQDPPCTWSTLTCSYAAGGGHLEVLKWLRSLEPPCPWVKQDCIERARKNHFHEVVEWILLQVD